jgi:methionine synthase II (cobalamin-independent)
VNNDAEHIPQTGTRLFQISEPDLAELERTVPALIEQAMKALDNNAARVGIRRVKQILTNVRWNYGPWSDVTEIPADGGT